MTRIPARAWDGGADSPPGPRGPESRAGRAVRPGQILLLRAAEELFGERSYHRTTVADICARAGMATGSFYSYYGSKAEIFAAVVRAINDDLRQAMRAALEHDRGRPAGQGARRLPGVLRHAVPASLDRPHRPRVRVHRPGACSASTTSTWPAVTRAACGRPRSPARWTRATTPRSSRSPTPASATSSGCAGPTGRRAAGSPTTSSTTCSSSWPAAWRPDDPG